jgi:hypothetical protein
LTKISPFDFVNAINTTKEDLIRNTDNPELAEKDYNPFLVNRALSYFPDTVAFANEMNRLSHLPHIMQNDFYLNIIRKRKRFSKWHKTKKDKNAMIIAEYYQCSMKRAMEYLSILTDTQIKEIEKRLQKGGLQKKGLKK